MKGKVMAGKPGKCCHRHERLVHLELADLVSSEVYLDSRWPNVQVDKAAKGDINTPSKKKAKNGEKVACGDCKLLNQTIMYLP
jgi:hypothetical protein